MDEKTVAAENSLTPLPVCSSCVMLIWRSDVVAFVAIVTSDQSSILKF